MRKSSIPGGLGTGEELEMPEGPSTRDSLLLRASLRIYCPLRRAEALREVEILALQDEIARRS